MKAFTLTLAWGDREEGNYHWAGRARDYDSAVRKARREMDQSYNATYWSKDRSRDEKRGEEGGHAMTEYEVVDSVDGVNEFAASEMLETLRFARERLAHGYASMNNPDLFSRIDRAIARGEGRNVVDVAVPATERLSRVAVIMEGGICQGVVSDDPLLQGVPYTVIDYDTEGADPETVRVVPQGDGTTQRACVHSDVIGRPVIDLAALASGGDAVAPARGS